MKSYNKIIGYYIVKRQYNRKYFVPSGLLLND